MQHAVASIFRLREIESFVHDCESKYLDARLKVTAQHRTECKYTFIMNETGFVYKFEFDTVQLNGAVRNFFFI